MTDLSIRDVNRLNRHFNGEAQGRAILQLTTLFSTYVILFANRPCPPRVIIPASEGLPQVYHGRPGVAFINDRQMEGIFCYSSSTNTLLMLDKIGQPFRRSTPIQRATFQPLFDRSKMPSPLMVAA